MRHSIGISVPGQNMPAVNPALMLRNDLWLRADLGITIATGVSQWRDLSVKGRNATQATPANQATFSASGGPNSRACLTFDGVNDSLRTAAFTLTQPVTVYLVSKWNTAYAANSTIIDSATAGNRIRFYRSAASTVDLDGGGTDLPATTGTTTSWHYWTLVLNGASSSIKQDNVSLAAGATAGPDPSGICIGEFGGGGDSANCSVAELIAFSGSLLSSAEDQEVVSYLKGWYAL